MNTCKEINDKIAFYTRYYVEELIESNGLSQEELAKTWCGTGWPKRIHLQQAACKDNNEAALISFFTSAQ